MAKSSNDLKSLSQIFRDDVHFVIPDYQRGYSWETKHLNDLWEDLENMPDKSDHYTGMFTFCQDEKDDNTYTVVDGQQRMTTLIILINELLAKIDGGIKGGKSVKEYQEKYLFYKPYGALHQNYRFGYQTDDPSRVYFITEVLGQSCPGETIQTTLYTNNLKDAKKFFSDKIGELDSDKLPDLFVKVTERLKFNIYMIDDMNEVYVTFETMNNRGKKLSTLELLKNRLIYLTTLFPSVEKSNNMIESNAAKLRLDIIKVWKEIYYYLGKNAKKQLNDDDFLKDHWIMYFKYDRSAANVFKDFLLYDYFITKRVLKHELHIEDIKAYVDSLSESIVHWFNINCPDNLIDEDEQIWLTRLNRIGLGSFRPLLMAAFCRYNNIQNLLEACERFRFLTFSVSGRRSNTEDSNFYRLARDVYSDVAGQSMTIDSLVDRVNACTDYWFDIDSFVNATVDRYQRSEGFYSWSGLRYFFYEYERNLQKQTIDAEEKVKWELFTKNQNGKNSIEHIYPQTPTDQYWVNRFKTEEDVALTHSLGNLLLLSVAKNAAQQNYDFEYKKKTIRDPQTGEISHNGYDLGSHSEHEVSCIAEWTPQEIINRGKALLKFLHDHWSMDKEFKEEQVNKLLNIASSNTQPILPTNVNDDSVDEGEDDEILEQNN